MRGRKPGIAVMAVTIALLAASASFSAQKPVATAHSVTGTITVRHQGAGEATALALRASLHMGDVVTTGPKGKATILFSDGSQVRLNQNSRIEITRPSPAGKKKQSLFRTVYGEVWARLRPGKAIQTRSAIAGVRGTEFELAVDQDETTTLTVIEGEVDFYNEYGEVVVAASQQSTARLGSAPTAPITIDNAGFIVEWTLDLERAVIPRESVRVSCVSTGLGAQIAKCDELARANPEDPEAHCSYGDALFDSRRFEEALAEFRKSDRVRPGHAATLTRVGDTLLELGRADECVEAYRKALAASPGHVPAMVGQVYLELTRNETAEAENLARQAIACDSSSVEAHIALGLALMRQTGKVEETQKAFEKALSGEPEGCRYQAHAWLALVRLAQDNREAALREAQEAVRLAPQSALAHGNLALACFHCGDPVKARKEARLALKLNPDSVAARCALGQAQLAQGDVDGAARTAAEAVAMDPALPQARYLLGIADAQRRDYGHAARELKECLKLSPAYLPAASALARVYNLTGRRDQAISLVKNLLPAHRNGDGVLAALGAVYYQQGKYAEAAEQYRKAIQLQPNSAFYHSELSRALLDANQLNEAITEGQNAVRLAPEVGQYHATLGLAYHYSRLESQAEREFREALALDPQNALAHLVLGLRAAQIDPREHRTISRLSGESLMDMMREGMRATGSTPAVSSITQASLYDPAISSQVLRGGVYGELTAAGGSDAPLGLSGTHRLAPVGGTVNSLSVAQRSGDDGSRPNDDTRWSTASANTTYTYSPRTSFFGRMSYGSDKQGLPGTVSAPSADDRANARNELMQLAVRHRVGVNTSLWLGLSRPIQHYDVLDPNGDSRKIVIMDSSGMNATGLTPWQALTSKGLVPEARMQWGLNADPRKPAFLSLGTSYAAFYPRFESDLLIDERPPPLIIPFRSHLDGEVFMTYAQMEQRVNDRFTYAAQLRHQRFHTNASTSLMGGGWTSISNTESRLLPSLIVNYKLAGNTLMRLLYNEQTQEHELAATALVPIEALLVTEPLVWTKGSPKRASIIELDTERYLGNKDFVKLFLFQSRARQVSLGDLPPMGEIQRTGWGVRYERQIGSDLFCQMSYLNNRTTSHTPFAPFDDGTAPYHPVHLAGLGLNYIDRTGTKVGLRLNYVGKFYQDSGDVFAFDRPVFPARMYVDLVIAKEPVLGYEFFAGVSNLFDSSAIEFKDYPTGKRRIHAGVRYRFL